MLYERIDRGWMLKVLIEHIIDIERKINLIKVKSYFKGKLR